MPLLFACGGERPAGSQVAAKVNREEISVHQVNFLLQRRPGVTAETAPTLGREVLEQLIDQELALQKAREMKVERDPVVQQAIEAARRDIVVQAYLQRIGEAAARPTAQEVQAYYQAHPALFAQRRIFTLYDAAIDGSAGQVDPWKDKFAAARTPNELAAVLQTSGLAYSARQSTQSASALPMDLLDRLAPLHEGQSLLLPRPAGLRVVMVAGLRIDPVSEEAARPAIEQFLVNDRKRRIAEQEVKALRDGARIDYVGSFAQSGVLQGADAK
ncbi:MAG: EpsD family peptidyl-prolyl cis-trans isomerase [Piscinibacter sp.]|nr:EpsD family peptidyl-prolyl cis-trans isomerase [Piscinibacter sp.]